MYIYIYIYIYNAELLSPSLAMTRVPEIQSASSIYACRPSLTPSPSRAFAVLFFYRYRWGKKRGKKKKKEKKKENRNAQSAANLRVIKSYRNF